MSQVRVAIIMGVSGSGKSTVGALLAARNGGAFYDADDFHPPANIAKMSAGSPLDDADRKPWLARLRQEVIDATAPGDFTVLACSALREIYREQLGIRMPGVALVYLRGDAATLAERLGQRSGHYMQRSMLESQLATLEEPSPDEGITVGIETTVGDIAMIIEKALGLSDFSGPDIKIF